MNNMSNSETDALTARINDLEALLKRQHQEHFGWLNQMLQQENQMLTAQVESLRKEHHS